MEFGKYLLPPLNYFWMVTSYLGGILKVCGFVGTEGNGYKCMHLLEFICYTDKLAHSSALGGLTCFRSKKILEVDTGSSLA